MGTMFDWEREAVSADPSYYRWTQWFFNKLIEMGLAYRKMSAVDFCPHCNTTLAREQVWGEDRHCERCGTPVIKKDLEQWFFKTTDYAEELLDFSEIDWPERVVTMQTNWIGRSDGADVTFHTEAGDTDRDLHHAPGYACGARPSWSWPPNTRWWTRLPRRSRRMPYLAYRSAGGKVDRYRSRNGRSRKNRRLYRRLRHQSGQQGAHPDLDRRLCDDELWLRGDHGCARS